MLPPHLDGKLQCCYLTDRHQRPQGWRAALSLPDTPINKRSFTLCCEVMLSSRVPFIVDTMRKEEDLTPAWPDYLTRPPSLSVPVSLFKMPYPPLLQLASLSPHPWQIASSSSLFNLNFHNENLRRSRGIGDGSVGECACCASMRIQIRISASMYKAGHSHKHPCIPSA